MRRRRSYNDLNGRQRLFAWIILSVYVPMVLLSSLHFHALCDYSDVVDCDLCHTAVHHSGHITNSLQQHDECCSCRFLSTLVDVPKTLLCFVPKQPVAKIEFTFAAEPVIAVVPQPSLRAPPFIL